jgi:osmoprotectant transport system substrate-binding protein
LIYNALRDGHVDASLVFATDGRIPAFNFRVLKDDKNFFISYSMAPVVRKDTLEENPQLGDQLEKISHLLDSDIMSDLNARVDVEGKSTESVAREFLKQNQLL